MAQTPFDRYGGFATVSKLVLAFYDKVLDSEVMGDYFEDVDMRRLIDHQTQFVSQLMGGPVAYTDDMLRQLHTHLGITHEAFDEMVELFTETLEDFELDEADVEFVGGEMSRRRGLIVAEPADSSH